MSEAGYLQRFQKLCNDGGGISVSIGVPPFKLYLICKFTTHHRRRQRKQRSLSRPYRSSREGKFKYYNGGNFNDDDISIEPGKECVIGHYRGSCRRPFCTVMYVIAIVLLAVSLESELPWNSHFGFVGSGCSDLCHRGCICRSCRPRSSWRKIRSGRCLSFRRCLRRLLSDLSGRRCYGDKQYDGGPVRFETTMGLKSTDGFLFVVVQ